MTLKKVIQGVLGGLIVGLIALILLGLLASCTSTSKMAMPDGCKPPKKAKYEMVKPKPTIERKK